MTQHIYLTGNLYHGQKASGQVPEAERREMERPKAQESKLKHSYNLAFDQLLSDHARLPRGLSKAMTRPAYKSTSIEQKTLYTRCDRCGYYKMSESGKMKCQFPWDDPQEYDRVLLDYLPCKEVKDEKD